MTRFFQAERSVIFQHDCHGGFWTMPPTVYSQTVSHPARNREAIHGTVMDFEKMPPFDPESGAVHVIIDTPKGSRNKYSWSEKWKLFEMTGVLPAGAVFPFDFGFVPQTRGGDGDPLDVLVLMDEPGTVGCLVRTRLIGVIKAEQTEEGETSRNDRLIGVAVKSRTDSDYKTLDDLSEKLVDEIEHFFVSYNSAKGKKFKPLGRFGPERAKKLVKASVRKKKARK